ncbi:MAG: hypothetical protein IPK97_10665 [Ahniella sp.]|nr:hypothetical protein [Ahniella sp.]
MRRLLPLLLTLLLPIAAIADEPIRLAPPEAMFKDSIKLQQFVRGTLRFVLLHETGHGFVDLYGIPVLGREEDAADRFATWWLSPDGQQDGSDAIAAVEWWLALSEQSELTRTQLAWWGEHGIDEQRGYQIICLLYGSDPETMGPLAGRHGLPESRRASCIPEAQQNEASWRAYLGEQGARFPLQLDGFIAPVNLHPVTNEANQAAAQLVRDWGLLTELSDLLKQFRFPEGKGLVRLHAQECGSPNAYWNPQEQSIVLCYELVNLVAEVGVAAGFKQDTAP